MEERSLMTYPTWERYTILAHQVMNLSVRDRRLIFQYTRSVPVSPDLFFPAYGFTLAEFAVWYTLGDTRRSKAKYGDENRTD